MAPASPTRAVIPTIITQLLSGASEIRLGSVHPTRDMNFVTDTAAGFIALAESAATIGREVNICTGKEISVGDLATLLIEMVGTSATIVADDLRLRPEKSEVERLLGDSALMRELTGWSPQVSLREGLARTIEWLGKNMDRYKLGYTV
jgi:nucleoside-diphosphate-sugar epimerase